MMPGLLQAMMQFMTSLTVGVQGLSVRAQVLLTLAPLSSELPVVKAMHVSMLRPPTIDYNITLTKGAAPHCCLAHTLRAALCGEEPPTLCAHTSRAHASVPIASPPPPPITLPAGESTILNVVKPWLRSIISSCFTM